MKKKLITVMVVVSIIGSTLLLGGWSNQSYFDTTYTFDKVQIAMPDGTVVKGKVQSWQEYENSDAIQIRVNDKTYYTHLINVVLIDE